MLDKVSSPSPYFRWWTHTWGAAAVAGALLGWLTFGPLVTVVTFLVGFALGATWWLVATGPDHAVTRAVWAAGWFAGAACIAIPAIAEAVSGVLAFWLTVFAVATSPLGVLTVGELRERIRPAGAPAAGPGAEPTCSRSPVGADDESGAHRYVDTVVTEEQVRAMATEELCRRWRSSYLGLGTAQRPPELAEVLRVRQTYLDELHRRHPEALEAWFAAGGRAASGPERFLRGPGDGRVA